MSDFRHPDHRASAEEWIGRGLGSGNPDDMAHPDDPAREAIEHAQRVGDITLLVNDYGPDAIIGERWAPGKWWPVAVGPEPEPVPEPDPEPEPVPDPGPVPPDAIILDPGTHLQKAVDEAPAGATFLLRGVHVRHTIRPKDRQTFLGEQGAVLDGDNLTEHAFVGDAVDVTIRGLEITNYRTRPQKGAIEGAGRGWTIAGCEVHHNAGVGVRVTGDNSQIIDNDIHHNAQLGISVSGDTGNAKNCLVVSNEIAFNNFEQKFEWGWEAGGTKFWRTVGLVVADNWSHHNHGPGLWSDKDNVQITYEDNRCEDNIANGIFHEIGGEATIRNNTIRRCGQGHAAWIWGAGILIASSSEVIIEDNFIEDCHNGITISQQNRGSGAFGPHLARNIVVRANDILRSGSSGAAQDIGDTAIFAPGNIRFGENRYRDCGQFAWDNRWVAWDAWRAFGQDTDGTFS